MLAVLAYVVHYDIIVPISNDDTTNRRRTYIEDPYERFNIPRPGTNPNSIYFRTITLENDTDMDDDDIASAGILAAKVSNVTPSTPDSWGSDDSDYFAPGEENDDEVF